MFERFSDKARRSVVLAQEEAVRLNHNYIGTEHVLLGLLREGEGIAARSLGSLGLTLEAARANVEEIVGQGPEPPSGHIPFTPRAKKVLELALREALHLHHNYISTEHILLGLLREGEGVAAQVLVRIGPDLGAVRERVLELASSEDAREQERPPVQPARTPGGLPAGILATPGVPPVGVVEWPTLDQVIPIGKQVALPGGERLVVISLEVWSVWTTLRSALLAAPGEMLDPGMVVTFLLSDPAGTHYEHSGAASSGVATLQFHQTVFQPAPPAGTRTLTLTAFGARDRELATFQIDMAAEAAG